MDMSWICAAECRSNNCWEAAPLPRGLAQAHNMDLCSGLGPPFKLLGFEKLHSTFQIPLLSTHCVQAQLLMLQRSWVCRVPNTMLMMEALVSKACQELICYETMETLGDAFLKFAVSVHLYRLFPNAHEGTA